MPGALKLAWHQVFSAYWDDSGINAAVLPVVDTFDLLFHDNTWYKAIQCSTPVHAHADFVCVTLVYFLYYLPGHGIIIYHMVRTVIATKNDFS